MRTLCAFIAAMLAIAGARAHDNAMAPIAGGTFEASGVVALDGGALFVDDGRAAEVFWMSLDSEGRQTGSAEPVHLGAEVHDMEGMATDGTYVYVVGSQSKKASQRGIGLARFKFDAAAKRTADFQSIDDLRGMIFKAFPEVAQAAGRKTDGLNIEGLAWDSAGQRLLLGLRSPVVDGHALIVALRVKDANGRFDRDNVELSAADLIKLPIDGGIRSLAYDGNTNDLLVLSANESDTSFALWRWQGTGAPRRAPLNAPAADASAKPEGVAMAGSGPGRYTLIVFDTSRYVAMR
jgi:hypothetical protein